MKIDYIKPEILIVELDPECYLQIIGGSVTDEEFDEFGSKERGEQEESESDEGSGWGALW